MRLVYDRELERMVPKDIIEHPIEDRQAWAAEQDKNKKPFVPSIPLIISDDLGKNGVLNHADGKKYDSKSAYYRAVRDAGCEVVGDDPMPVSTPSEPSESEIKRDVAQTLSEYGI